MPLFSGIIVRASIWLVRVSETLEGEAMILSQVGCKAVVTAFREDTLQQAAEKMRVHHVGDVVVVKRRRGKLVPIGILTDRDIVVATLALKVEPERVSVGDVMSLSLVSAKGSDSLAKVIHLMKRHGVRRIPMVGRSGELKGIVAVEDILHFLSRELGELAQVFPLQRKIETKRRLRIA